MPVQIYTNDDCPYCTMAKRALIINDMQYEEYRLNYDFTRAEILDKFPEAKTFPIIVLDGSYIGGYAQLKSYLETRESF